MSLPPYKHKRNPCLQTVDEPLIPGLAGAPLITHRSVQEKRRTSDQRLARIQNMPSVEFEYEYVPATQSCSASSNFHELSREKMIPKPQIEDHHYQQHPKSKTVNFGCASDQGPPGPSGDRQDIGECGMRTPTRNYVVGKSEDQKTDFKDENHDAKSTCSRQSSVSRRSLVSHCSQGSRKTESSSKSQRSRQRSNSRESLSSTLNAVLKTPAEKLCFQKFGRTANGLDDDDLGPRRR